MRPTVKIVTFLIFLNGAALLLQAAGVTAALGVDPVVETSGALDEAEASAQEIPSGQQEDAGTLFGAFQSVTQTFTTVLQAANAGPSMFRSLGVPDLIVDFIFAPLYLFIALDVVYYLTGRRQ